jgi:ATP-dependent DNA helicase RecQ
MSVQISQAKSILKRVFGYDTFWPLQEDVIVHLLDKQDALVVLPTGGGKSLCYQIPALLFEGLTIVVSPLLSLMKDQVDQLKECGVPAVFLNSTLTAEQYRSHVERLRKNAVKLLYLAPETLLMPRTMAILSSLQVDCFAIDEAHCISEWGHDFRPEYRKLMEIRSAFPAAACVSMTATATPRVREDIRKSLQITAANEFIGSFNRPNLFLEVAPKTSALEQTLELLNQYPNESGIIYCFSRRQTDDLSATLARRGYSVRPYHAGLSDRERIQNQELFIRDDIRIIVATIAFGMGINKSNVRFVVHYDFPKSLDSYYQEIGRAGRDGLPAHCLLLFGYGDIQKINYFIQQKDEQEQMVANILLSTLLGFAETDLCRRVPLLNYFGETHAIDNCGMCDNCRIEQKDPVDITIPVQMFLSCVKRTGERFGAGHIVDVLRGSQSQKVLKFGHEKLSTYGIGTMYSAKQWRYLFRQLIQKGLLVQELEHGTLKLTGKAWEVLKGKETVMGRLQEGGVILKRREEDQGQYDPALFEMLRRKRKELADQANLPPFTIFHDRTLKEMAVFFPQTWESLTAIYGIGAAKIEKYGHIFLEIIRQYREIHQIPEQPEPSEKISVSVPTPRQGNHIRRHIIIGEAYHQGKSIEQLAGDFNIKQSTVLDHLYQYWQDGYPLERDEFLMLSELTSTQQQLISATFDRLGTERLRPIFDVLNSEIDYEEIKILRLSYLCRHCSKKIS